MAMITLDFSDYHHAAEWVEPGRYNTKVYSVEDGKSKSGNPMFTVEFELLEGEYAGQLLRSWLPQTGKARFKLAAFLDSLKIKPSGKFKLNPQKLVGKKIGIVVADADQDSSFAGRSEIKSFYRVAAKSSGPSLDLEDVDVDDDEDTSLEEPQGTSDDEVLEGEVDIDEIDI